jgi:quercetin dioxygenase-like cupin family protein
LDNKESAEPATTRPDRTGRLLNEDMETFKLDEVVDWLQTEAEYRDKGHNALTLVKDYPKHDPTWDENKAKTTTTTKGPGLRMVVVCIQKGQSLTEHKAPGRFTLTMLRGRIRFILEPQGVNVATEVGQGELLSLGEPLRHEVQALEDSAFLLTIAFSKGGSAEE